ncbi:MAG TPA: hypothetical protein ENJ95_06005 [Bacteroidetes bacterium]|nr:hypothetical protein [Bacteroidota bacterium]
MAQQINIYQDFADFIASLSPEKLLTYYAPKKMQQRVDHLVALKKEGKITAPQSQELEKYFILNHNRFCAFALASPQPQKGSICPLCTKPIMVQYMFVHIVRLAKAKALKLLSSKERK